MHHHTYQMLNTTWLNVMHSVQHCHAQRETGRENRPKYLNRRRSKDTVKALVCLESDRDLEGEWCTDVLIASSQNGNVFAFE